MRRKRNARIAGRPMSDVPNKPVEQAAGIVAVALSLSWAFAWVLKVLDWVSRAQTAALITPYMWFFGTPAGFLSEFVVGVGLLLFATHLERNREIDAAHHPGVGRTRETKAAEDVDKAHRRVPHPVMPGGVCCLQDIRAQAGASGGPTVTRTTHEGRTCAGTAEEWCDQEGSPPHASRFEESGSEVRRDSTTSGAHHPG